MSSKRILASDLFAGQFLKSELEAREMKWIDPLVRICSAD